MDCVYISSREWSYHFRGFHKTFFVSHQLIEQFYDICYSIHRYLCVNTPSPALIYNSTICNVKSLLAKLPTQYYLISQVLFYYLILFYISKPFHHLSSTKKFRHTRTLHSHGRTLHSHTPRPVCTINAYHSTNKRPVLYRADHDTIVHFIVS